MEYAKKLKIITDVLSKSQKVNSYNDDKEKESNVLAHSLLDIEESSKEIINSLLPKLISNNLSEEEIDDVLFDLGEELRHILHHINSPKFYEYLKR